MTNPTRTWTIENNDPFDEPTDTTDMFQQSWFELKNLFVLAGWTVVRSSDGTTASASDNIASKSDVGLGINGNGAWIVFSSPAGFSTPTVYVLFAVDTNDPTASPYGQIELYVSTQTYTGGSSSSLPTTAGTEDSITASNDTLLPGSTDLPRNAYMHKSYTSVGDIIFYHKPAGAPVASQLFLAVSNSDSDGGGQGAYRFGIFNASLSSFESSAAESFQLNNNSTYWIGFDSSGGNAEGPEFDCVAWDFGWTDGIDGEGEIVDFPIDLWSPASARGRYMGTFPDIRGTATLTTFGALDDSESSQTQRKVVIGDIWVYATTASLPLL